MLRMSVGIGAYPSLYIAVIPQATVVPNPYLPLLVLAGQACG